MIGKIIKNVSNTYIVVSEDGRKYECTARGKLKIEELKPVVGDNVEIEKIDETTAVIKLVLERSSFLKRPRILKNKANNSHK